MQAHEHRRKAQNIERSLAKCEPGDYEIRIEAAMLAGTHWLNAALHQLGASAEHEDVVHTYLLTINEFRRLAIAGAGLLQMLAEIEDLRPLYVRGDAQGGPAAADRACELLSSIREMGSLR